MPLVRIEQGGQKGSEKTPSLHKQTTNIVQNVQCWFSKAQIYTYHRKYLSSQYYVWTNSNLAILSIFLLSKFRCHKSLAMSRRLYCHRAFYCLAFFSTHEEIYLLDCSWSQHVYTFHNYKRDLCHSSLMSHFEHIIIPPQDTKWLESYYLPFSMQ